MRRSQTRIKAPFPLRRLTFPLQSPRSAALVLPRICSIHRHLGIGCDFRRGFICTLTSITSFSSVTVCFALNLLLFSFTPPFALFQSLPFIAQSAQWGAQQSGSTDTREWKSISFLLLFYHLCPFFFFTSHPTLPFFCPSFLTSSSLSLIRPLQISFLSVMFLFFQNQLLNSAKKE